MSMIKIKYWKDSGKKKIVDEEDYSREQKPHAQALEVQEARGWRGLQEMPKEERKTIPQRSSHAKHPSPTEPFTRSHLTFVCQNRVWSVSHKGRVA